MLVKELIALLQQMDGDTRVVLPGYENSGADDVASLKPVQILLDRYKGASYMGMHEVVREWYTEDETEGAVHAYQIVPA
jgi:hypothetical protein